MTDNSNNTLGRAILEAIQDIKTDIVGLRTDMVGLKHDMIGLKHDMAGMKSDMAGLKVELHSHADTLNILLQDVREIRTAMNDIERTRVSTGEIEALHHDVTRMQRGLSDLTARVTIMETARHPLGK